MSNNKQSSIEFLLDKIQLSQTTFTDSDGNKYIFLYPIFNINDIEQCKEMHREEIEDAYDTGKESTINARLSQNSYRYYNETFGGGEQ